MTTPDAADSTIPGRSADFTIRRDPHTFTIDDDTFKAPAILSQITLRRIVGSLTDLGDLGNLTVEKMPQALEAVGRVVGALMPGPSGRRFVDRLNADPDDIDEATGEPKVPPIDLMRQAIPALMFLLECYGLRPTAPSSTSSDGSTDGSTQSGGESSEAGASPSESESTSSTPPTSST
jgi:hypothetical protein